MLDNWQKLDFKTKYFLIYIDQKVLIFLKIEPKFSLITSFCLVSTKASSGVMENVSLKRCITNILENVYIYNFDQQHLKCYV